MWSISITSIDTTIGCPQYDVNRRNVSLTCSAGMLIEMLSEPSCWMRIDFSDRKAGKAKVSSAAEGGVFAAARNRSAMACLAATARNAWGRWSGGVTRLLIPFRLSAVLCSPHQARTAYSHLYER